MVLLNRGYYSFAPSTHAAFSSDSSTNRHSISFSPHYFSNSQLLMSTTLMHTQSLASFFYWNTRTTRWTTNTVWYYSFKNTTIN